MPRRVVVIQGHPDPDPNRFCRALADAYAAGAMAAGHPVRRIEVAQLDFPILHTKEEFQSGEAPEAIRQAQETIGSALPSSFSTSWRARSAPCRRVV